MFRPKKMRKVRILVLKSNLEKLIKELHEAGLMDIRKSSYEGLGEGAPLASFDEVSAELLKLRSVLSIMESSLGRKEEGEPELMPGAKAMAEAKGLGLEELLKGLNQESSTITERIKTLENSAATAEKLSHYRNVDFSRLGTRTLGFKVGEVAPAKGAALHQAVEKLGGHATLVHEAGAPVALVLFDRKNEEKAEGLLAESGFGEIELPQGMTTPPQTLERAKREAGAARARLKEVQKEIATASKAHIAKVRSLMRSLDAEAERAEIAAHFVSSKNIYVIEGWTLEEAYPALQSIVQHYGPAAMVEDVRFGHREMPPTVLGNPEAAGPLEYITNTYSMPNYFELDPTMAYFLVLPLMYGMIVGDFLYGIMSLGIAWWLMNKFSKSYTMRNVCKIWLYSAIPTMFFGIVFDEYGGMSHAHLLEFIGKWTGLHLIDGPLYTGFHRMENVLVLVGISVLIGWLHLIAGFIMGAINEWEHNRKHAYAKIAWIGIEVGMLLALLPFLPGMFPQLGSFDAGLTTAGGALLLLSVVALAATEGFMGVIEVPSLLGNIISYSRIAALGIAGVVIAELVNEFIIPLPQSGIMALLLVPLFLALHLVNCFIAMFESLIQGGRLNIVEFRSKFMHGGAELFVPFALHSKK